MRTDNSLPDSEPESTDAMWDTRPAALAARFGARACELMRQGRPVAGTARLAFSYAFLAKPVLRMWVHQ